MQNRLSKQLRILILLGLLVVLSTTSAFAITAANTQIINSADLSYNDGSATRHATAEVIVNVVLKPAAPTIQALGPKIGPQGTPLIDDYILTNNANGPDTFVLLAGVNTSVNGVVTATPGAAPAVTIKLGATVTLAGSTSDATTTTLVVPSDGVADLIPEVNGIKTGDTIVIDGKEKIVISVVDNASGTSSIVVSLLPPASTVAGLIVGERATIHATVSHGTPTDGTKDITANATMTATSQADNTVTASSLNVANTFYPVSATLTKYVRNFSNANGSGANTTFNSVTYYKDATVQAKPGEILEYLLVAANGSSSPVTQVVLTDMLPVDFVDLVINGVNSFGGKAFRYYPDITAPGFQDFTASTTDDAVDYNATSVVATNANKGEIRAWIGGVTPTYNTKGTIAASSSMVLLYRVTVK